MVNTRSLQQRFDRALGDLAVAFTDALLLVEALDARLERIEQQLAAVGQVARQWQQGQLDAQIAENNAARKRLDERGD